ncbi:MAG: ABC transporter ATP-binding protein [Hydrogenobacter thermophilus]|uniref:ABC transporter ATP-binding protein n=1 Tax=Hydrogenobacter thermophilus (strain DSM 6534 / IAM 12695 / TK-6) TaxID=608538 RepID=D3DHU5_HYDTT|nr:ABC transporter ATP-binding protein [Hydrogenobacter thermophilus]ADO45330.1 ABC transporter related protein [Hydrogenobacter thermophilus TK-6]MCS7284492.1 ABC transporter ATP-binding protein [Hydrogenobacter thermophilus]BAI69397.1 ABC transporter ATP-binding protein [Hydrogenobacter thermophilus TK-6]
MALIELREVKKTYRLDHVEVHVLKGISMSVERGEVLAIMGPSGSGKSTLMNIIGCLDVPTEGEYILDGVSIKNMSTDQIARVRNTKVGFVFQSFNLIPRLTALENVELPMIYAGVGRRERKKRAVELLKMVGLGDRIYHYPSQLSGGQQQRVAIARAIANNPPIILADEPTGSLDTATGNMIMDLLLSLNERLGTTLIVVTHEPAVASYCKRVVRIKDGLLVE